MERPLYVSDLDGTLLHSSGELSPRTQRGILALLERDVNLTFATARSHFSVKSVLGKLPLKLPIIEFNGAFLTDYASGEHLEVNALGAHISLPVLDVIRRAGFRPFISSHDGARDRLHYDELINEAMRWYMSRRRAAGDPRVTYTRDLESALAQNVVSMTVMAHSESALSELSAELLGRFGGHLTIYQYENSYSPGTWWLTIHHPQANKLYGVRSLMRRLHGNSREGKLASFVAFGDHHNDLQMLESATLGVAVANAVDAVKNVAHQVIGHCDEDSVIHFVERHSSMQ
jgi:5-amino-6-(5-phospho-D-ribitylamino)uracil phosphatase